MSRSISIRDIDPSKLGPNSPLLALMRRKPRRDLEHEAQCELFRWVFENETKIPELRWLYAVPNGGFRHKATAGRIKAEGARSGVPDLIMPVSRGDRAGLAIELKIAPNRPTKEQKEWLNHLRDDGWFVWVAYSADEAKRVILDYLAGKHMRAWVA